MSPPALLVVLGASGVGKTAAVEALARRRLPGVRCYHFDSVGVPSAEAMTAQYGGPEQWQASKTREWIDRLGADPDGAAVYVLEGQTRPSFARPALDALHVSSSIVLLDCTAEVRRRRLIEGRDQAELVTAHMESWAAYLRGQADALGLPIVDTSDKTVDAVTDELSRAVKDLESWR